jgi:folate-dependent phosphoribosylglycinamide formyltransferase PurN
MRAGLWDRSRAATEVIPLKSGHSRGKQVRAVNYSAPAAGPAAEPIRRPARRRAIAKAIGVAVLAAVVLAGFMAYLNPSMLLSLENLRLCF